jgi:hypothetical protein
VFHLCFHVIRFLCAKNDMLVLDDHCIRLIWLYQCFDRFDNPLETPDFTIFYDSNPMQSVMLFGVNKIQNV